MIRSIEIKHFRGIREGKLDDFTPVVVLVGPNGSGKSTILDALLIGASPNLGSSLSQTLQRHPDVRRGVQWLFWRAGGAAAEINLATHGEAGRQVQLKPPSDSSDDSQNLQASVMTSDRPGQSVGGGCTVHVVPHPDFKCSAATGQPLKDVAEVRLIDATSSAVRSELHELYTTAVQGGRREEAIGIIVDVVPGLKHVEILTEGNKPILHLVFEEYSVPAALAGDGTYALLGLSLSLASPRDGVVLLEEPEVHLHPAAIRQSARAIWAAVRREVQIILSTHSLELIDALVEEAKDDEELDKLSLYGLKLDDGLLRFARHPGRDVAFARNTIESDLR